MKCRWDCEVMSANSAGGSVCCWSVHETVEWWELCKRYWQECLLLPPPGTGYIWGSTSVFPGWEESRNTIENVGPTFKQIGGGLEAFWLLLLLNCLQLKIILMPMWHIWGWHILLHFQDLTSKMTVVSYMSVFLFFIVLKTLTLLFKIKIKGAAHYVKWIKIQSGKRKEKERKEGRQQPKLGFHKTLLWKPKN